MAQVTSNENGAFAALKSPEAQFKMGAILGRCALPDHVVAHSAQLAEEFFAAQEEHDFAGDDVETHSEPLWLKRDGADWRPDVTAFGFRPTGKQSELVLTAGVDQHADDYHGPVLLIVIHNAGLKFKQGNVSHIPEAGDWFIFDDRKNHGVRSAKGRSSFIGWAIPLEAIDGKAPRKH